VINAMHAVRSLGAVAGSLAGAVTASWSLTAQFAGSAALAAVLSVAAVPGLLPSAPGAPAAAARTATRGGRTARRVMVLLGVMAFLASLVEDAPASWGGVYLRSTGAGPALAASAYAALSAGEVTARLLNDRLVRRTGWVRAVRGGTLGCACVLALALALGRPWVTLAALVLAGAGISAVFPGAYATAGTLPAPATAMAQVGFAGNAGWLLVSPAIGALATLFGLTAALGVLPLAAAVIAALAGVTLLPRTARQSSVPSRQLTS
jgi:fucose permease